MAATTATAFLAPAAAPSGLVEKSSFCGTSVCGLPALGPVKTVRTLKIVASGGKKITVKQPLGLSGDIKFKQGVDAQGRKPTGKGVYQFVKKYGANVDGYSPIWAPDEWSANGDTYAGGTPGLLLWAVTLAGLLAAGAFLVYSTSALA
ncbi:hypothetical protein R1sor_002138 [Riccia sorocarpa]|uniref:Photosystem II 10 kDa polypeptide, chloroplastic n=1 Tax=Riccia sorocarpa TaxID=122646 RepID=A0ABD3H253_9MARC